MPIPARAWIQHVDTEQLNNLAEEVHNRAVLVNQALDDAELDPLTRFIYRKVRNVIQSDEHPATKT